MKLLCNITEDYVWLDERAAYPSEIWECDGAFYEILDMGVRDKNKKIKHQIHLIYPCIKFDDKILENRTFTFVCQTGELEKFLRDQYCKRNLPLFK